LGRLEGTDTTNAQADACPEMLTNLGTPCTFALVSFGSATLGVTPSSGIWAALPPMAAAHLRPSFMPSNLVLASFPFPFAFPVYVSSSPISLTRWHFL
jgi:hypothetical protein